MMGGAGMGGGVRGGMMRLTADASSVPRGTASFVATNLGSINHELVILPLPHDQIVGTRTLRADSTIDEAASIGEASNTCGSGTGEGIAPASSSWTTVTLVGGNDTSVTSGHCYEYRELLSDHVGNQGTSGTSNIAKVDSQAPVNSITLSSVSPAGSAVRNGSTIYYRGSIAGSFKLTNAVSDADSGPASSTTATLGGTTTGWSHSASTVSSPGAGPYESNGFSWNSGTTSAPTEVVTGADTAGNTTDSATLTFTNDSTAPSGGALTVDGVAATGATPVSYDAAGSFPIDVRTDYSESGGESGLSSSTLVRTSAAFSSALNTSASVVFRELDFCAVAIRMSPS